MHSNALARNDQVGQAYTVTQINLLHLAMYLFLGALVNKLIVYLGSLWAKHVADHSLLQAAYNIGKAIAKFCKKQITPLRTNDDDVIYMGTTEANTLVNHQVTQNTKDIEFLGTKIEKQINVSNNLAEELKLMQTSLEALTAQVSALLASNHQQQAQQPTGALVFPVVGQPQYLNGIGQPQFIDSSSVTTMYSPPQTLNRRRV